MFYIILPDPSIIVDLYFQALTCSPELERYPVMQKLGLPEPPIFETGLGRHDFYVLLDSANFSSDGENVEVRAQSQSLFFVASTTLDIDSF